TLERNLEFIYKNLENPVFGGEWSILSLARGEYNLPKEYKDLYFENLAKEVDRLMEKNGGKLNKYKGSEHSRLILALTALGKDARNVGGHNIKKALGDFNYMTSQGINGAIYALIALDSHGFKIPLIDDQENQSTRQKFIDHILSKEVMQENGKRAGWTLFGDSPDPDMTAMAIQGLTPYYEEQIEVKEAVDRALEWLSEKQNDKGGFPEVWGAENSSSLSQVIVALTGLGIDPHTDSRFIKNGHSTIDNLMTYADPEGGFYHTQPSDGREARVNSMATNQATYSLVAYHRLIQNQSPLYDMRDVELKEQIEPSEPEKENNLSAKKILDKNLSFMYERLDNPSFGIGGGEWAILSLARAGYDIPQEYYDLYHDNTINEVERLMKKYDGKLNRNKGTEHSRLMLAFGALGMDITDVAGYDIREKLADFNFVTRQGINGPIFALIALDTHDYEIPLIEEEENQTSRQRFIDYILDKEISETGGWALYGNTPDPDITAMAIQGLTPYYEDQAEVKEAIDRGLASLSEAQNENGGYLSWGTENSESVAQVIVALTGLGIDPHKDARFIKNGHSAIDNLLTFAVPEGGFRHTHSGNENGMATEQGNYALVAYDRFINKQNSLYDMSDVNLKTKVKEEIKARPTIKLEIRLNKKTKEELEEQFNKEELEEKEELEDKDNQLIPAKEEVLTGEQKQEQEEINTAEKYQEVEEVEGTKKNINQMTNDNDADIETE
ncbi:MAG: terpene cyclase/mutase family protein, partial [Atopostipes suicloacalis]|nr:terpene cyclase/mutase family protein [Atopostipes suicloacalis]